MSRPRTVKQEFAVDDKFDIVAFGRRIYDLRKARGLSQVELARRLGGHGSKISLWENGQRAPEEPGPIIALADLLGVSIDYLLTGKEPQGLSEVVAGLEKLLSTAKQIQRGGSVKAEERGPQPAGESPIVNQGGGQPFISESTEAKGLSPDHKLAAGQ